MECYINMTGTMRCCPEQHGSWFCSNARKLESENIRRLPCKVAVCTPRMSFQRLIYPHLASISEYPIYNQSRRTFSVPANLEKESTALGSESHTGNGDEAASEETPEKLLEKPLDSDKLISLLADSERAKLIKKLSEANQHNRLLKRQLQSKEDDLVNFKSELAVMELEIQALVKLAEEIANSSNQQSSRKISGKYIQSHLFSRLEAVREKLKEQIKDVDAAQSKEVLLFWCGMAESVQVMGTFDGWIQGENLSPEYTGSFTKFSTTLMLRPGRYEIKFLVDGEWHLSPDFPTIGEGLMKNNLLVVE